MAAAALTLALDSAGITHHDLDLLIYAGSCHDYPVPHNSVIIKSMISDDSATFNCLDIDTTCLSFIQALDIASLYLHSGRHSRVAVVTSEMPSVALSASDPKVYGLFGDAAAAVILDRVAGTSVPYSNFENYPSGAYWALVPTGGVHDRGRGYPANHAGYTFKMEGRKLMKLGCMVLGDFIEKMEAATEMSIQDIDYIVPHQASKIATEFLIKKCNIDRRKVISTLPIYGNCISTSVALGLEQVINENKPPPGKTILLIGSGAGLTLGCMLLKT
jgi:3-oxoacyl-[acyl-carrier-protein] synthase-3